MKRAILRDIDGNPTYVYFTNDTIEILKDDFFKDKSIDVHGEETFLIKTEEQSSKYGYPIGTWMWQINENNINSCICSYTKESDNQLSIVMEYLRKKNKEENYCGDNAISLKKAEELKISQASRASVLISLIDKYFELLKNK